MLKKSAQCICISLNDEFIKVVQLKGGKGKAHVTQISARPVNGIPEHELPKVIQSALSGFNIKGSNIIAIVPSGTVTTKNIEIPSVDDEEIKSIVNLQAGRHTPFSREEIQIGFINLGIYKKNFTKVLLTISNRNSIKKQISILERAGLTVEEVFFATESVAKFYIQNYPGKFITPKCVIDIGKDSTEFMIVKGDAVISSRNISFGKTMIKAKASALDELLSEIATTVDSFLNSEIDQSPDGYIITTDDEASQALKNGLVNKLKTNVEILPYVDGMKASQGVLKKMAANFADDSFLDLIATASMYDQAKIHLMPDEIQLQRSVAVQGKEVFKTAIFGFIALVLVACIFGLRIYFHSSFLSKLKTSYQANRDEVVLLETQDRAARIVQNYLATRMIGLDLIDELYNRIPRQVYLSSIEFGKTGEVTIQGISDTSSIVYNLVTTLQESELFDNVEIKSSSAKKDRGKDVAVFEISLKIQSEFDAEEPALPDDKPEE